ncbi:MAG: phage tail protein [Ginsengibacter sp.]
MAAIYYPPTSFSFKVEFLGISGMNNQEEQRFRDVSGLSFEIETELFTEGGENRFEYKLPKRIKYPNLVLKRGLVTNSGLIQWMKDAASSFFNVAVYDFKPSDILISLLNESGDPLAVWQVVQAYPVKWNVSGFSANDNSLAIETMEFAYQYFERKL